MELALGVMLVHMVSAELLFSNVEPISWNFSRKVTELISGAEPEEWYMAVPGAILRGWNEDNVFLSEVILGSPLGEDDLPLYREGIGVQVGMSTSYGMLLREELLFTDYYHGCVRAASVREMSIKTRTVAGVCTHLFYENGPAATAGFHEVYGLTENSTGDVLISEPVAGRIRLLRESVVSLLMSCVNPTALSALYSLCGDQLLWDTQHVIAGVLSFAVTSSGDLYVLLADSLALVVGENVISVPRPSCGPHQADTIAYNHGFLYLFMHNRVIKLRSQPLSSVSKNPTHHIYRFRNSTDCMAENTVLISDGVTIYSCIYWCILSNECQAFSFHQGACRLHGMWDSFCLTKSFNTCFIRVSSQMEQQENF